MKSITTFIAMFFVFVGQAQIDALHYKKKIVAKKDSIIFHNVSTNPIFFRLELTNNIPVATGFYHVDYTKSILYLNQSFNQKYKEIDSLQIHYYTYPEFLTKTYQGLDPTIIITNNFNKKKYTINNTRKSKIKPFDGLATEGKIIRGITIGNNQDAVLNSILDLKIEGKLSSKVTLRARINDTNIPIQESGYSQDLKDLDRVYIEMEGPKWGIRAGDVTLGNSDTYFMNFNKKVSGVALKAKIDNIEIFASGALVRGRYTHQYFQGQEANQGPYKLNGKNGESYIFIISGSEKVFINGLLQSRGKDKDYTIDYNTAEVRFTPTKPITSDMRIHVEYQYSDRNFNRFMTHDGVQYNGKKSKIGVHFFNESDVKSQPLQLSLSEEQISLLANAEENTNQIFVNTATETQYDENKILYKLITVGDIDIYEYTTEQNVTLFQVGFTYFGENLGDYQVEEFLAIGKKMKYVGENNGSYKAVIPLVAPSKQQLMVVNSSFIPNNKTEISIELAYSDNNENLFSSKQDHKAPALKASWKQVLKDTTERKWQLKSQLDFDFLHHNFKSIERVFAIEFDRNWNISNSGQSTTTVFNNNQALFDGKLILSNKNMGELYYGFENLNFVDSYYGNRHRFGANLNHKKWSFQHMSSLLQTGSITEKTQFGRTYTALKYNSEKWWVGSVFDFENNQYRATQNDTLTPNSFQYSNLETLFGVGDSTAVFVEAGFHLSTNDSLRNHMLKQVNHSQTIFVNSQFLKSKNAQLNLYTNYRKINYVEGNNTEAINSKITYKQELFDQFLNWQTHFQNISGNVPQQDYTYIETEVGQGYFTWVDYNANGLQELDEFEVAQFADQANFLRIALPNIHYLPTQEARLEQGIQLNFSKWATQSGLKKIASYWYNQFNILAQNNIKRGENLLNLNPFDFENPNALETRFNLRNALIFNKGKYNYTTAYNYSRSRQKMTQTFGNQENWFEIHQLNFQHKIKENWLLGFVGEIAQNQSENESFPHRNFKISNTSIAPNLSYLFSKKNRIKIAYGLTQKRNKIGILETLDQHELSINYQYSNEKQTSFSVDIKALKNLFEGDSFSAVGYYMLEGLQPDNNMTWNLLWSYKINSYLFLNINYNGRANTVSRTVHNGNVQLRANF